MLGFTSTNSESFGRMNPYSSTSLINFVFSLINFLLFLANYSDLIDKNQTTLSR